MKSDAGVLVERFTIEIKSGTASDSDFSVDRLKQWLTAICLNFFFLNVSWESMAMVQIAYEIVFVCATAAITYENTKHVQCSLPIRHDDISVSK